MNPSQQKNNKLSDTIRTFWPILVAIIAVSIAWGGLNTRQASGEQRLGTLEGGQIDINKTLIALQIGQAQMQSDISFIKQRVK